VAGLFPLDSEAQDVAIDTCQSLPVCRGVVPVALPSPLTPVNGSPPLGPVDAVVGGKRCGWCGPGHSRWRRSDRLVRVAGVIASAEETFGSREKARAWLRCPTAALANESPRDLLDTDEGAREVERPRSDGSPAGSLHDGLKVECPGGAGLADVPCCVLQISPERARRFGGRWNRPGRPSSGAQRRDLIAGQRIRLAWGGKMPTYAVQMAREVA
jgi:hypothetical protein